MCVKEEKKERGKEEKRRGKGSKKWESKAFLSPCAQKSHFHSIKVNFIKTQTRLSFTEKGGTEVELTCAYGFSICICRISHEAVS